jgi:hypothetical protein
MNNPRKDAGEARQRPRPPVPRRPETSAATPTARPAGSAPVFDAGAGRLAPAREDAPRGMISNPWVKQWAAGTPEGKAEEASPQTEAGPGEGTRRPTSDAGSAPTPARDATP